MSSPSVRFAEAAFPALALCAVVESRYSSRTKILRELAACMLFETVIEAESVEHAKAILRQHPTDICIIGPSVSLPRTKELIADGRKLAPDTCAFLMIVDQEGATEELLLEVDAHEILSGAYSKQRFGESIVKAVLAANTNSPWSSIVRELTGQHDFQKVPAEKSPTGECSKSKATGASASLGAIARKLAPHLTHLAEHHERGEYGLLMDGSPTRAAEKYIDNAIAMLLVGIPLSAVQAKTLQRFLKSTVVTWYREMVLTSSEQAMSSLNRSIELISCMQSTHGSSEDAADEGG
ncbi:MAG: hypothetical protein KDD69_18450 [Bdellovibrionales bacterium]|nr:hypothetical protein [Bdellovibrionales bacterium]